MRGARLFKDRTWVLEMMHRLVRLSLSLRVATRRYESAVVMLP